MLSDSHPLLGGHHVSCCQISRQRCDDDHSAHRGGPTQYWGASVRGLTTCWIGKSSKWLPPYTANQGCDCLRKVDLGTGSRGNPKDPAITTRETTIRTLLVWDVAAKSAGKQTARGGPAAFRHYPTVHDLQSNRRAPNHIPSSSNHAARPEPSGSQRRISCSPAMAARLKLAVMQFH